MSLREERVLFQSQGLQLEGVLHLPEGPGRVPGVAVCHPHPAFGGDMDNNVVMAVASSLGESGIAALRFNFRGVGRSQGSYSGGAGEREDAVAAISFLASAPGIDHQRLGLAGYSFGASVAMGAFAGDPRARAAVAISLPTRFSSLPAGDLARPVLLLSGDEDEFSDASAMQGLARGLPQAECLVFQGADHFWWGYEGELAGKVTDFLLWALRVSAG